MDGVRHGGEKKENLVKGLDSLRIWQIAIDLATYLCKEVLPLLPIDERWALAAQLRRAAQSIPSNIAEGYGRYHYLETIRFCYIARGSLEETYSHLILAHRLGYIDDHIINRMTIEINTLRYSINSYISYLKRSKRGESVQHATPKITEDIPLDLDITDEDESIQ